MLKQTLHQKLLQKLSPQQIQLMKLLQLPTVALEQRIKEEMEINPALEEGKDEELPEQANDDKDLQDDELGDADSEEQKAKEDFNIEDYLDDEDDVASYKLQTNNSSADDEKRDIPFVSGSSFHEQLESQLGLKDLSERKYNLGIYLIGNIDEDGYLRRDLASISDDLAFTQNISTTKDELEEVLKEVQDLDPAGIGARDLRECLLLQLKRKQKKSRNTELAIRIVSEMMEEFSKKHYDKIAKRIGLNEDELRPVINEILKLNPKPGGDSDTKKTSQDIIPDFILINNDGRPELMLNSRNAPELKVSRQYQEMLEAYAKDKNNKAQREATIFVKQKIDAAKWFIDAIKQRQQTLMFTMSAILEHQKEYFREGDETLLKPMILKDIADKIGLDISTVSRVANSKYIQTPFGTFLLKSFFSEALSTESGEEVSSREVKKILKDCIEAENKKKPLTDDRLTEILKEKGYNIARRTIAKYREQLEIPVARMRKEI